MLMRAALCATDLESAYHAGTHSGITFLNPDELALSSTFKILAPTTYHLRPLDIVFAANKSLVDAYPHFNVELFGVRTVQIEEATAAHLTTDYLKLDPTDFPVPAGIDVYGVSLFFRIDLSPIIQLLCDGWFQD